MVDYEYAYRYNIDGFLLDVKGMVMLQAGQRLNDYEIIGFLITISSEPIRDRLLLFTDNTVQLLLLLFKSRPFQRHLLFDLYHIIHRPFHGMEFHQF